MDCSACGGTAWLPDSTRMEPLPFHSFRSRSASSALNPNAAMKSSRAGLLSSRPDSARETVSLSWCGCTPGAGPTAPDWYLASTSDTASWLIVPGRARTTCRSHAFR